MKVVFRADASLQIGTGHVMRCLTLADALAVQGAECVFICRAHPGNLLDLIRSKGHRTHVLPIQDALSGASLLAVNPADDAIAPAHSGWLGSTQSEDADACMSILVELHPDWLIVDHYALDVRWEQALKRYCRKLMVIDDLADRLHSCDLLLDQTFGRQRGDYRAWVPADCQLLCGSHYALLRPDFAALRPYSLRRRAEPSLQHLLVTMGGVDKDNATGQILSALRGSSLPGDCRITVVMGSSAPWLAEVEALARDMPWPTQVRVGVSDMAQLMADSDLAIGAAGATSWERSCLGLPAAMVVLASNQTFAAKLLQQAGAVQMLMLGPDLSKQINSFIYEAIANRVRLKELIDKACKITDGSGCERVVSWLLSGESKK